MKKIIITGGSGFLGTQITQRLLELEGYEIVVMDIVPPREKNEHTTFFKKDLLEPFDYEKDYELLKNPYAVIHLSGKSINGRFTEKHKRLIYDTRVLASQHLVELLSREEYKPESLVAASAVGYYGNQPGEILVESSDRKNYYFLSDVVEAWEEENLRAQQQGVNVTCIRNGHIIGRGGILTEVAKSFRFGIGGILGTGKEHLPWIDVRDLVELYIKAMEMSDAPSIINGVNNQNLTQKQFSQAIGEVKKTKLYLPVPRWVLSLKYAEFGREMLVDQNVQSELLEKVKFIPKHSSISDVIRYYLKE
ncbi:MAG: hypothetical protein ACJAU8_000581 [Candidatus Paceibacteria bacterium]|jgi:uncharacterized protein (TIGR01777 family)